MQSDYKHRKRTKGESGSGKIWLPLSRLLKVLSFFALSEPIWVCDLGTGEKNRIFDQLIPDFDGFWFFAAYWVCGKQKKIIFTAYSVGLE